MPSGAVPAVDPWAHMDAQEQTLLVAPETGEVISEPPAAPRVARSTASAPAAAGGASGRTGAPAAGTAPAAGAEVATGAEADDGPYQLPDLAMLAKGKPHATRTPENDKVIRALSNTF